LNTFVIAQKAAKHSDAYKFGPKGEKHLNTHADLVNSWANRDWHQYTGDFWGPIFANLKEGGGWLTLEEIFDTGYEHRFVPKSLTEEESWERQIDVQDQQNDDPAIMLYKEGARVYRDGVPAIPIPINQLFEFERARAIEENRHERHSRTSDEDRDFHQRLEHQLSLEREPETLLPEVEVDNWSAEVENAWTNFSEILQKSGLQQRVEIEAFVRKRCSLWVAMDAGKRELYHQWKIEKFVQQKDPHQILLRDVIMSMQCLEIPHSHYACPICWRNLTVHKEASAEGMRKHCFHAHSLPAYRCHDPITLTLRQMIGQDIMLAAEIGNEGHPDKIIVRGNYQQCYHLNCQHRAVN
jgi:hypothetical protein